MKNVEIAEGGIGRRLSGTKFVLTDKPNSDQMEVWVDEDDRKLARLYATSNGTYYPEDYDAYGFSSVTVSIHGGVANPDLPNIELPDGTIVPALIPEIEMPDGTILPIDELFPEIAEDPLTDIGEVKMPDTVGEEGSSIVGIDPEDGYTYKVDVDENGNLEVEKVPTGIEVIKGPDKTEYGFGEAIDYDGMEVALVDKDGNIVKTKEYPTGTIPLDELTGEDGELPKTTQERDKIKGTWTVKTDIEIPYKIIGCSSMTYEGTFQRTYIRVAEHSAPFAFMKYVNTNGYQGWFASPTQQTVSRTVVSTVYEKTSSGGKGEIRSRGTTVNQHSLTYSATYNGKTVYYSGVVVGEIAEKCSVRIPSQDISDAYVPIMAWYAVYGRRTAEQELPVLWSSPYSGTVYEDGTTVITSDPENDESTD